MAPTATLKDLGLIMGPHHRRLPNGNIAPSVLQKEIASFLNIESSNENDLKHKLWLWANDNNSTVPTGHNFKRLICQAPHNVRISKLVSAWTGYTRHFLWPEAYPEIGPAIPPEFAAVTSLFNEGVKPPSLRALRDAHRAMCAADRVARSLGWHYRELLKAITK
jgi:hypothetical protein